MFSVGRYGGFYIRLGYSWRICLGWVALTLLPTDVDKLLRPEVNPKEDAVRIDPRTGKSLQRKSKCFY